MSRLQLLQGILPVDRARLPFEALAGLTLAALAIPEVMGYTAIAGTPVVTGLYTLLLPLLVFAVLGSSRHLVVAADSATAAILAAGLVGLAAPQSADYVALASLAALLTAGWLLIARLIGLAFLADFLSRSVLIGFLTGVGIQVAAGQVGDMLGVPTAGGGNVVVKAFSAVVQLPQANKPTLIVSLSVFVVILGLRLLARSIPAARMIPGALIALVGSIVASYVFDLASLGVTLLGPVPGGLPHLGVPLVSLASVQSLLTTTLSMFVVILAQSAATSRAYAARYQESLDENTDLIGLSMANLAAGLSGTFVVNGSPTKTEMVDGAGARNQLAQISCALVVLVVLLFLTGPLAYMPNAVLAAIVFLIGVELINIRGMRDVFVARQREFWVALLTAAVVILAGVEQAVVVAMAASLVSHTRRGYSPVNSVLVPSPEGIWHPVPVSQAAQALPGVIVYRFTHGLYYANAQKFQDEVLELTRPWTPPLRVLCVDGTAIDDVDYTGGATLCQIANILRERKIELVFTSLTEHVRQELDRSGVTAIVGRDAYISDLIEARKVFEHDQQ
jgi:MFS superfamily sulfate permease-like transporter